VDLAQRLLDFPLAGLEQVPCQPGKRTRRTISSMSVTTRSTMIGVSAVFTSLNSAVSAALPRSSSSSGGVSFRPADFLGDLQQLLEELDAVQYARLEAIPQRIQPFR
jgi:hypothetical protein